MGITKSRILHLFPQNRVAPDRDLTIVSGRASEDVLDQFNLALRAGDSPLSGGVVGELILCGMPWVLSESCCLTGGFSRLPTSDRCLRDFVCVAAPLNPAAA